MEGCAPWIRVRLTVEVIVRVLLWSVAAHSLQPLIYDKNQIRLEQISKKKSLIL